jgi:hypothetical protein
MIVMGVGAFIDQKREAALKVNRKYYLINKIDNYINTLKELKTLRGIYKAHLDIWATGIRNANIGPNEYGMFRTKDILHMKPEEVYLGNINGLWTFNIPTWEKNGVEPCIIEQYRNHLISNLNAIKRDVDASL